MTDQNRYIIDIRRVHAEISSGVTTVCKYCGQCDSTFHCGFSVNLITPETYLSISNRGFFRTGNYFWKQNQELSCCKEFTIRLHADKFKLSSTQKNKWNRFLRFLEENKHKQIDSKKNVELEIENIQNDNTNQHHKQEKVETFVDSEKEQITQNLNAMFKRVFPAQKGFVMPSIKVYRYKGKHFKNEFYSSAIQQVVSLNKQQFGDPFDEKIVDSYRSQIIHEFEVESKEYCLTIDVNNKFMIFINKKEKEQKDQSQLDSNDKSKVEIITVQQSTQKNTIDKNQQEESNKKQLTKENDPSKINQNDQKMNLGKAEQIEEEKHNGSFTDKPTGLIQPHDQSQSSKPKKNPIKFDSFSFSQISLGPLKIILVNQAFDKEIYDMHCNYYQTVHGKEKYTEDKFIKEKCLPIMESTIITSSIDGTTQMAIGHYFFKYFLHDKLIAVSQVDILPEMLCSQYFFYLPELKQSCCLGTISTLIEIEYVKRLREFFPSFAYFNFVQYLPGTQKMKYKSQFMLQEILCPITNQWVDLTKELRTKIESTQDYDLRLADKSIQINPDNDFSEMNIETELYENCMLLIDNQYNFIYDLIPEAQPTILQNLASIIQAMGKQLFRSLTFGY